VKRHPARGRTLTQQQYQQLELLAEPAPAPRVGSRVRALDRDGAGEVIIVHPRDAIVHVRWDDGITRQHLARELRPEGLS
jgi:hypothetical protein